MNKLHIRLAVISICYLIYVFVGGSIFAAIEGPVEQKLKTDVRKVRTDFLHDNLACLSDAELESFIVAVVTAQQRGVSASSNVSTEPNWSIGQSIFFAGTILTTIGYGHVTPLSEGGKIFCIFYAVIGIPLTLIVFSALVERLLIPTEALLKLMLNRFQSSLKDLSIRLLHLTIVSLVALTLVFFIPAAIFSSIEDDWNYLDAIYYCFISMTTIGLGDYIPGDNEGQHYRPLYKICTTLYLFIGLILMMLCLATLYEIPELNIGKHFYLRGNEEESPEARSLRPSDNSVKYTEQVNESYDREPATSASAH